MFLVPTLVLKVGIPYFVSTIPEIQAKVMDEVCWPLA
jgi:hypothetical protein